MASFTTPTRTQLAAFAKDPRVVLALEGLFQLAISMEEVLSMLSAAAIAAGNPAVDIAVLRESIAALASAPTSQALNEVAVLRDILSGVLLAPTSQALNEVAVLRDALSGLAVAPMPQAYGEVIRLREDIDRVALAPVPQAGPAISDVCYVGARTGLTSSATLYMGVDSSATEANATIPWPLPGWIDQLFCDVSVAPGAGDTYIFTARKNGADQLLAATISEAETSASDLSNAFVVAAGDLVCIEVVATPGAATSVAKCGFRFRPTS